MGKQVRFKGEAVSKADAYRILRAAKSADSRGECPYRRGWAGWSVWMTAFRHKQVAQVEIMKALVDAGVVSDAQ